MISGRFKDDNIFIGIYGLVVLVEYLIVLNVDNI